MQRSPISCGIGGLQSGTFEAFVNFSSFFFFETSQGTLSEGSLGFIGVFLKHKAPLISSHICSQFVASFFQSPIDLSNVQTK